MPIYDIERAGGSSALAMLRLLAIHYSVGGLNVVKDLVLKIVERADICNMLFITS